jgi:hypothetical protein
VLFLFKCGLASKARLRHLSWNNSDGSATIDLGTDLFYTGPLGSLRLPLYPASSLHRADVVL